MTRQYFYLTCNILRDNNNFNLNYLYYFNEVKLQNEDIFAVQEVEISVLKLSGYAKLVSEYEQDRPEDLDESFDPWLEREPIFC